LQDRFETRAIADSQVGTIVHDEVMATPTVPAGSSRSRSTWPRSRPAKAERRNGLLSSLTFVEDRDTGAKVITVQ